MDSDETTHAVLWIIHRVINIGFGSSLLDSLNLNHTLVISMSSAVSVCHRINKKVTLY